MKNAPIATGLQAQFIRMACELEEGMVVITGPYWERNTAILHTLANELSQRSKTHYVLEGLESASGSLIYDTVNFARQGNLMVVSLVSETFEEAFAYINGVSGFVDGVNLGDALRLSLLQYSNIHPEGKKDTSFSSIWLPTSEAKEKVSSWHK